MESMTDTKILDFNEDKSRYVIFGKGNARNELEKDFKERKVKLYGREIQSSLMEKYLGDHFGRSLEESIEATISKRVGRATQHIH